ncbi:S10 family peptidase [Commensalibacter oyaizuii]|uniref:Peptidase S10 n=1 Tax=Commensalibacter oyaizuii TaxID=3043873 RepID=A0ABT6Q1D7_9PROT|nr:peptidase S10 [Commensalibacter sp. TBRC 16381]MDI2090915.1 peptidase S10 [Commensalibacter sp. TBRC 16381]
MKHISFFKYLSLVLLCSSFLIYPKAQTMARQSSSKYTISKSYYSQVNIDQETTKDRFDLFPPNILTQHKLVLAHQTIDYTAHTGTLIIRNDKGEPTAKLFYVAYTKNNPKNQNRPVSFFFNGGPGAGSAFLNLGAAGPQVINFPRNNPTDGAHAQRTSNPDSWLPFTDMVFIDAVDTGYSLSAKPENAAKEFYTTKQDAKIFAKAIQLWLSKNNRNDPPIWLVGESYGGLRSIMVAKDLQDQQNILIRGIIMISPAIELGYLDQSDNPMANAFLIPSYIASQLENTHQLTEEAVNDAYHYALGEYLQKMVTPSAQQPQFYQDLSQKTGLPETIIAKHKAVLDPSAHDIRSRDGRLHSLYDYTLTISDPNPDGTNNEDSPEPVLSGFGKAYGNMFANYVAQDLNYPTPLTYNLLNMKLNSQWNYHDRDFSIVRGMPVLRKLLALNPSLKIFIGHGYFDVVCPFATSRWIADQMPVGKDRITLRLYKGGHMLYTRPDSRAALTQDVRKLYEKDQTTTDEK